MIKLRDILLNEDMPSDVKDAFGKIPFGGTPAIAKLTTGNTDETEEDTPFEDELIKILRSWVGTSSASRASKLYSKYPLLKKAMTYFPNVLKPRTPNGTTVYRGLGNTQLLDSKTLGSMSSTNFSQLHVYGMTLYRYNTPIDYKPRSDVQSWASNLGNALVFAHGDYGNMVLETKQNDEFLFSQKLMKILMGDDEDELLHFGKTYSNDVFLLIDEGTYNSSLEYMGGS
jgi:hypothetical protein